MRIFITLLSFIYLSSMVHAQTPIPTPTEPPARGCAQINLIKSLHGNIKSDLSFTLTLHFNSGDTIGSIQYTLKDSKGTPDTSDDVEFPMAECYIGLSRQQFKKLPQATRAEIRQWIKDIIAEAETNTLNAP